MHNTQLIDNSKYAIRYFSIIEGRFVDPIGKISRNQLNQKSLDAHVANSSRLITDLNEYQCVLDGIYPIPPRSKWAFDGEKFTKLKKIARPLKHPSYDTCVRTARRLLQKLDGRIAVELSGGLDSAIIIGMLDKLGCEPVLIGVKSQLYKFRTERHVQEVIAKKFKTVIFTDTAQRQFVNFSNIPQHFLPSQFSLNQPVNSNLFELLKEHNIRYLLNGTAFDAMLVEPFSGNFDEIKWPTLEDNWQNDYVYFPKGTSYIDVAGSSAIRTVLLSLRNGDGRDNPKWWARKFFAEILPDELSQYAYKANFSEQWWDYIAAKGPEIEAFVQEVHKITPLPVFENFSVSPLLHSLSEISKARKHFATLSYAQWVHALQQSDRLID